MLEEKENYIKEQCNKNAEKIVDVIFDNWLLNPKLKRKDIRVLEKLISINMSFDIISSIKTEEILKTI